MSAFVIRRSYEITGTFCCFALVTIAPAEAASTASRTITSTPLVRAASACCCCFAGSWSAFEYTMSQSEQSSLTLFSKRGRSCDS
jgi:hypothetical protein